MPTLQDFLRMDADEISNLKNNQIRKILVDAEREARRRINLINKAGRYSWAAKSYLDVNTLRESWDERYPNEGVYSDKKRYWLLAELQAYYGFLNSKSSTVSGIKEIDRQQDIRLFGYYMRGEKQVAKHRMDDSERVRFWELYNEFINSNPAAFSQWGSSTVIQQTFYEAMSNQKWGSFTELFDYVSKQLDENKTALGDERYDLGTNIGRNSR